MDIKNAVQSVKDSLFWGNWSKVQADALRTLLVEVEKVKILEEENTKLREQLNKYGNTNQNKPTNADRIRVMSDEELAEFLVNVETHGYHDQSVSGTLEMIDWLQSEVE